MAQHAFDTAHRNLRSVVTKNTFDRHGFDAVVFTGARAVGRDVVDARPSGGLGVDVGFFQGSPHGGRGQSPFWVHVGDAIRVGGRAIARNFGQRSRAQAAACSADSKMTIAEPSPITNPPRVRLKGRLAAVGSSFAVESAVNRLNPVTPSSCNMVCVPPVSMRSASPRRIKWVASPMDWVPAASGQAVGRWSAQSRIPAPSGVPERTALARPQTHGSMPAARSCPTWASRMLRHERRTCGTGRWQQSRGGLRPHQGRCRCDLGLAVTGRVQPCAMLRRQRATRRSCVDLGSVLLGVTNRLRPIEAVRNLTGNSGGEG